MTDLVPPRIEPLSDPHSGRQGQPPPRPRVKPETVEKPAPAPVPDLGAPDEEENHELDEMA